MSKGYYYVCDNCGKYEKCEQMFGEYYPPEIWHHANNNHFCSISCLKTWAVSLVETPKIVYPEPKKRVRRKN